MKKIKVYFGITIEILSIIFIICSHFLQIEYGTTRQWWLGIEISNFFTDLLLYISIGFQIIIIILWIDIFIDNLINKERV